MRVIENASSARGGFRPELIREVIESAQSLDSYFRAC
jgi:hypothetical protein